MSRTPDDPRIPAPLGRGAVNKQRDNRRYGVVIADPPWSFEDRLTMSSVPRGSHANYPTLDGDGLIALGSLVQEVTDPDGSVLALWVVGSQLELGLQVMRDWGFEPKQTLVWVKTKKQPEADLLMRENLSFGMGRLFRQSHELVLVGSRGKTSGILCNRSQRSVIFGPNQGHSIKPDDLHESLEVMFPQARKLEMFARRRREGWTTLGNEIDGNDIRDALAELLDRQQLDLRYELTCDPVG